MFEPTHGTAGEGEGWPQPPPGLSSAPDALVLFPSEGDSRSRHSSSQPHPV